MNRELFYETILLNVFKEIRDESKADIYDKAIYALSYLSRLNEADIYDKAIYALSYLSQLNEEDIETTIDRHYLKVNMSLLNALSLCNDLWVEDVEVILKGFGMVLFHGEPNNLIDTIGFEFLESIECSIYNNGYSILVKHIDSDIIGDSND